MFYSRYSPTFSSSILLFTVTVTIIYHVMANTIDTVKTASDLSVYQPIRSIYYNLSNHQPLDIKLDDSQRQPYQQYKYSSRGTPCECNHLTCECCVGVKIGFIDLNRTCAKAVIIPEEFSIQLQFLMNDETLIKHTLSGRNPAPICPPLPYIPPLIKLCVRFYNMRLIENIFMVCTNFEVKTDRWSVFILHFDCMEINISNSPSITFVDRPDNLDPMKPINMSLVEPEVYDEVNFEQPASMHGNNVTLTLISDEDENDDVIGTLKT